MCYWATRQASKTKCFKMMNDNPFLFIKHNQSRKKKKKKKESNDPNLLRHWLRGKGADTFAAIALMVYLNVCLGSKNWTKKSLFGRLFNKVSWRGSFNGEAAGWCTWHPGRLHSTVPLGCTPFPPPSLLRSDRHPFNRIPLRTGPGCHNSVASAHLLPDPFSTQYKVADFPFFISICRFVVRVCPWTRLSKITELIFTY